MANTPDTTGTYIPVYCARAKAWAQAEAAQAVARPAVAKAEAAWATVLAAHRALQNARGQADWEAAWASWSQAVQEAERLRAIATPLRLAAEKATRKALNTF